MSKILELREKRAKLWDSTKAFLDSKRNDNGVLSAEDTETYEKMEVTVVNLGKEIDRLERQAALNLEVSKATSNAIKNNPNANIHEEKTGRASNEYVKAFWNAMRNKNGFEINNNLQVGTDSVFNLESYIAKEFARRIGAKEEEAFFIGDGTGKPTGIFNAIGGAQLGVTAASATAITLDEIMDLFYSLKSPYRKNSVFVMNDATVKAIRKLKDGNGQYIWQASITAGTPDTILNRPVKTSAYVPTIASAAKSIAFGDFSYYWVADRQGRAFKRLNELYAAIGQVGFMATQRVDGKLILPEAIKVLQHKV